MRPRVCVDFNEMLSASEVLLSKDDAKVDSEGNAVVFFDGKLVAVYMNDQDEAGNPDCLIADGVVVRNTATGWSASVPWVLTIDHRGIRRLSEEPEA